MKQPLKPLTVRQELLQRKIRIFSFLEFSQIFSAPHHTAKYFLEEQTKQGLFIRLKQGLYALNTDLPSEEEIANALYRPSYISFEYALAYYNLLPEMPYRVTSATTKPTRLFVFNHVSFPYHTIKTQAFTGYVLTEGPDKKFLIAEPEKAFIDTLYFYCLNRKPLSERIRLERLDRAKVIKYSALFNLGKLNQLLETVYA